MSSTTRGEQTLIRLSAGVSIASAMDRKAAPVTSAKWTDGGYPLNTMDIKRSAVALAVCALAFMLGVGLLLLLGLVTGRMAVPWSSPARFVGWDNLASFLGSSAAWLALAGVSPFGMRWALRRLRRDWRRAIRVRAMQDPKQ
jgi:hypothetical protein